MLSTKNQTLAFYSTIINDPSRLAQGYELITNYLKQSQEHRKQTLLHLVNPQVPILSLLLNLYPIEIFGSDQITQAEKYQTLQFLLGVVVEELQKPVQQYRAKDVSLLFELVHKIHNIKGFRPYTALYFQALQRLSSNVKLSEFLIGILKQADDRVSVLSLELVPRLASFEFNTAEEKLQIYYYMLKSLSFMVDTDPQPVDQNVRPQLQSIIESATLNMQKSATCLKFSLKILTLIFGDYGEACPGPLVNKVEETSKYLMVEYIKFLNQAVNFQLGQDLEDQQPIETALYQMLQLLMTLFGCKTKLTVQTLVYLCAISTYLGQAQYRNYGSLNDQYLLDVEDQGDTNIRNKSTYFLTELLEHDKYGKKSVKLLSEYVCQVLLNMGNLEEVLKNYLNKHNLPLQTLQLPQIYIESALFIVYSFTDELLQENLASVSNTLLQGVKESSPNSIQAILSILILNKCARKGNTSQKQIYLSFLTSVVPKFTQNVGMLIALARGIYEFSTPEQLIILRQVSGVPLPLVTELVHYLLRQDSAQDEATYLILQFLIHLLKCESNRVILQEILTFQAQLSLLKKFLGTGMTCKMMSQLIIKLANRNTINALYQEVCNGYARDQTLPETLGQCLRKKTLEISQPEIMRLCQLYSNKLQIISSIVTAYIETYPLQNQQFIAFLSQRQEWLPGLLRQGKLQDLPSKCITAVRAISTELQSLEQVENRLVVPYFLILREPQQAIVLLKQHDLFVPFFQKVYRYAGLFQGIHLKIVTSHVFITLAEQLSDLTPKVLELVQGYGQLNSSQWQDEEDQLMGMNEEDMFSEQGIIERMFNRIVNERVEQVFKTVFGEVAWDSQALQTRLETLKNKK